MAFGALEGLRREEVLPAVLAWIACAINEREEAINWALDTRVGGTVVGDVPSPWKMPDGTYKTYPEEADFYPTADIWWSANYAGFFLKEARSRICHMIGSMGPLSGSGTGSTADVGGPVGGVYSQFDVTRNAFYMSGDWRPWGGNFSFGGAGSLYGTHISEFLRAIGYADGRWISEPYEVSPTLTTYVDTPADDPRKWYQLREAIQALRWFRVLSMPLLDKTREDIQITQGNDPYSDYDFVYYFRSGDPAGGNNPPDAAQSLTNWEDAWSAKASDTVFEFAPLAGVAFVLRNFRNMDTPDQYDYRGLYRVETVGRYTMKLGYLENFKGTVVGDWVFSWDAVSQGYMNLVDSFGNTYATTPPNFRVVHHMPGSVLALGVENTAELIAELPDSYPLGIGDNPPSEDGGFTGEGQGTEDNLIGAGKWQLKCEGSFTYT